MSIKFLSSINANRVTGTTCVISPIVCASAHACAPIVVAGGLSNVHATATYQGKIDTTLNYQNYFLFKDEANTINFSIANGASSGSTNFFPYFRSKVTSANPALYFLGNSVNGPSAGTGLITFDGRINDTGTGSSTITLVNFVSGYEQSKTKIMADGTVCTMGNINMFGGSSLGLVASAGSSDSGKIVFYSGASPTCEWGRIWVDSLSGCLQYRNACDALTTRCVWHSGNFSGGGLVWTGSTNNGVGTYSSSGTICAEPNLTFDGTSLVFAAGATRCICMGIGNDTLCINGADTNLTKGGDIKIQAGEGFTKTGGTVCIIAGDGDVYGRVTLVQNNIEKLATTTTGVLICGNIGLATGAERIICFNQAASSTGSQLTVCGNQGAATSVGGVVKIIGGNGGSTSGTGGAVCLAGGGTTSGIGGAAYVIGGSTGTCGGAINICGGGGPTCGGTVNIAGGSLGGEVKIYTSGTDGDLILHGCYNGGSGYVGLYYNNLQKLYTVTNGICLGANCGFGTDWVATSDCRLKTDIQPITNALSVVNQLCGICYKLCDDIENENRIGLIAQNVLPILPEVVSRSQPSEDDVKYGITDDKLGIKYDKLTALLIEAIKEQQEQINELKLEIEKIKAH
jgi:hypothetical protein